MRRALAAGCAGGAIALGGAAVLCAIAAAALERAVRAAEARERSSMLQSAAATVSGR